MKILLTNDDGINAPGIRALYDALTDSDGWFGGPLGEVIWPIAPLTVQSATSHGVTFHQPLMVSDALVSQRMSGLAVDGRPADCVKLALSNLWPDRFGAGSQPDLVISGLNSGANVGINVIYSGTVAAALEAAFLGAPSIAVSLHIGKGKPLYDIAARHARTAIEKILAACDCHPGPVGLERHTCINVNVPITEQDTPTPEISVCRMNTHGLKDAYERRVSPAGDVYYWASGHGMDFHAADEGADVDQLFRGRITVTPLKYDLTSEAALEQWQGRLKS